MKTRQWISFIVIMVILIGAVSYTATVGAQGGDEAQGATVQYEQPEPLEAPLTKAQLRSELVEMKEGMCQELELIAGVIINTGILSDVPPRIQEMTGMNINELESLETQACLTQDTQQQSLTDLVNNVQTIEWLVTVHLAAMDDVTMEEPVFRPINAEGAFADFYELHDVIVTEMRDHLAALSDGSTTLDEAQALGEFWQEVLVAHAQAEERELYPLLRSLGDESLTRSANLVENEHQPIDEAISRYKDTLQAVEAGEAEMAELVRMARDIRSQTELHFGREEATLIGPLQQMASIDQFQPVVEAQAEAIGPWLRDHGWTDPTAVASD